MRKRLIILIVLVFICCWGLPAKDKKKGANIIIQKKDGKTITGELLTVKSDAIILMDSLNQTGITQSVKEIKKITVVKKGRFFKGLGLGLVIGGGSGALLGLASGDDEPGWFSLTAEQKAAVGGLGLGIISALTGGIIEAIKGIDETVVLEGRTPKEMSRILKKLNAKSRSPQAAPQIYLEVEPDPPGHNKGEKSLAAQPKKTPRVKFSRLHISLRPGVFSPGGTTDSVNYFDRIGMGDTMPRKSVSFLWFYFGSYGPTEYPKVSKKSPIHFSDIRIDYSLTRHLALGIGYAPLGKYSITGYKKIIIPVEGVDYYSEFFLHENYSGEVYYLSASWMPIPDPFLDRLGIKLGISAGLSNLKFDFHTSKYAHSESGGENILLSKRGLVLMAFAEFNYYLFKNISLGVSAEYRYIPVRIDGTRITGYYDDVDDNMELIRSSMAVDLPEHSMNLGGFCYGITLGFHF
jgi:hypothetical protein